MKNIWLNQNNVYLYNSNINHLKNQTMANNTLNFWNHEYRFQMRDLKQSIKNQIKRSFKQFGLELNGTSDMHFEIIQEHIGEYMIEGETIQDMETRMASNYIIQ